jgi:hypothetical protein
MFYKDERHINVRKIYLRGGLPMKLHIFDCCSGIKQNFKRFNKPSLMKNRRIYSSRFTRQTFRTPIITFTVNQNTLI